LNSHQNASRRKQPALEIYINKDSLQFVFLMDLELFFKIILNNFVGSEIFILNLY